MNNITPILTGRRADVVISDGILPTSGRAGSEPLTMSSREIAELLGARHDNVKVTVERLANRGIIEFPATQEIPTATKPMRVYLLDKRSSLIVVAQLSPEFTARVVDRWQELEAQVVALRPQLPDLHNPLVLRNLLLASAEREMEKDKRLAIAEPKAEALHQLADMDGTFSFEQTAANLDVPLKRVFLPTLIGRKVLFRRVEDGLILPATRYREKGFFRVREVPVRGALRKQTRVSAKGEAWLATNLHWFSSYSAAA
ncbi:Rha family transcriptional regulator [Roseixanthobacter pseudopolyaromaticivorans]|uniref:Rha family transcriptional regulator n=1 Tax=Xanthobacteraceae TaxID=335928 RepID=UPI00372754B2